MTTWRMEDLDWLENAQRVLEICVMYPDGAGRERAELEVLLDDGKRAYMYPPGGEVEVEEAARTAKFRIEEMTKESTDVPSRRVRLEGYGEQSEWRDLDTGDRIEPKSVGTFQVQGSLYGGKRLAVEVRDGTPGMRYLGRLPVPGFERRDVEEALYVRSRELGADVVVDDGWRNLNGPLDGRAVDSPSWSKLARLECIVVKRQGPHAYGLVGQLVDGETVRLAEVPAEKDRELRYEVFGDPREALAFAEREARCKEEAFAEGGQADRSRAMSELQGPLRPEVRLDGQWPPGSNECPGLESPELLMMSSVHDPKRRLPPGGMLHPKCVARYDDRDGEAVAAHLESTVGGVGETAGTLRLYSPVAHSVAGTQDHAMRVHAAVLEREEARAQRSAMETGVAAARPMREGFGEARARLQWSKSGEVDRWRATARNEAGSARRWLVAAAVTAGVAGVGFATGGAGVVAGGIGGLLAAGSVAMWGEAALKARRARRELESAIAGRPDVVVEEGDGGRKSVSERTERANGRGIGGASERWEAWTPGPEVGEGGGRLAGEMNGRAEPGWTGSYVPILGVGATAVRDACVRIVQGSADERDLAMVRSEDGRIDAGLGAAVNSLDAGSVSGLVGALRAQGVAGREGLEAIERVCLTEVAFLHTGKGTDVVGVTNENEPLLLEQELRGKTMLRDAALRYGFVGDDSLETLVSEEERRARRVEAAGGVRSSIPESWRQTSLKQVPDVKALKDGAVVCGSGAGSKRRPLRGI